MIFRILPILVIVVSSVSFGQEVELNIEPRNAEVGEIITITVRSTVQGEVEIDNLPSSFVQGSQIQSFMETEMNYNTGELITIYQISQIGAIGKSGNYTIGPAYVKAGNVSYPSNKVLINIGDKTQMTSSEVTNKQLQDPAFGVILTNKSEIYEGEPLLVTAKVYSHFDPSHLEGYQSYSMKGTIERYPIGSKSRINKEQERYRGFYFYTFEYDKNVVFPIGTGNFKISSYKMNLRKGMQGFPVTSSSAVVNIKPLPANQPSNFVGGVGQFSITRSIDDSISKQGEVFKMKIVVEGRGNLQNLMEPIPELPKGCIVYGDPIIEEDYIYTSLGAEGHVSYEYNIQTNNYGTISLPPTKICYFDPKKESYIIIQTDSASIDVEKDKNFIVKNASTNDNSSLKEIKSLAVLRPMESNSDSNSIFGSLTFWTGVSLPFLSAFLFLFYTKNRKNSESEIERKILFKRKEEMLIKLLSEVKVLQAGNDNNAFYSKVEQCLKKGCEITMGIEEQRVINKTEILNFFEASGQQQLKNSIKTLLDICEQSRYGFSPSKETKIELVENLEQLLNSMKI